VPEPEIKCTFHQKLIHVFLILLKSSDPQLGETTRTDQQFFGSTDWRCRSESHEAEVELQLHAEDPQRRRGLEHPGVHFNNAL
jgi:hypothetical protein